LKINLYKSNISLLLENLFFILIISILFISPLLEASWDVWSKTIIHILTILTLLIFFLSGPNKFILLIHNFSGLFIIFFVWLIITLLNSQIKFNSELELHNWINYFLIFFMATSFDKFVFHKLLKYVISVTIVIILIGFYQFFIFKQLPTATLINPNILAGYLVLVIPVMVYYLFDFIDRNSIQFKNILNEEKDIVISIFMLIILIIISSICLVLTRSIGAIFAIISALLIQRYRFKGFIIVIIIAMLGLVIKINDPELINRYYWWKSTVNIICDKPIFGIGLGNFEFIYPKYRLSELSSIYSHSYYLQLCSEIGIIGVILFLIIVIKYLTKMTNPYFKISVLGCLIQNIFDYNLYIPANAILFWIILASSVEKESFCNSEKSINEHELQYFKKVLYFLLIIFILIYINAVTKIYMSVKYFNMGRYFLENNLNLDLSENKFLNTIKVKNNLWYVYGNLGDLYLKKYNKENYVSYIFEAINEFEKGLRYNPYCAQYYYKLALIYNKLRNKKQFYYYKLAIVNDPLNKKLYKKW